MTQKGVHNMNKIIVNRKEASVRFVSEQISERRFEAR